MSNTIRIDVDASGIATLTLDNPGKPVNLVTPEFTADLEKAIERVAGDAAVTGVLITSAKRDFMAGADLKDLVTA